MSELPAYLPPGHVNGPADGAPTVWLGGGGWDADLHRRLLADFPSTGWWPVLIDEVVPALWSDYGIEPWTEDADRHDPAAGMAELWAGNVAEQASYEISVEPLAPFGAENPGLAPSLDTAGIDEVVDDYLAGM